MRKTIIIVALIIISSLGFSQQDALFSQYMFNKLVINPAYTGTRDALSMTLVARQQWVGLDKAPRTATFSIHSPLNNDRIGVGLFGYTDHLGPISTSGLIGSYSYKIPLGSGKLSFGLQAGFKQMGIDWSLVKMKDGNDVAFFGEEEGKFNVDANFGLYYYTRNFYIGASSKHLFEEEEGVVTYQNDVVSATLLRHFYGMSGVAIPLNANLVLKPSVLVKYVSEAPVQVDLNMNLLIQNRLWVGASYRTQGTMVFLVDFLVTKHLRIGYSYDIFMNELSVTNKGSHEILLGYDIPVFKSRMRTPRYF